MNLLDLLVRLFTDNGYLAVFVVLLVCGCGVPIPEDITLVAGGIIAGLGYADVRVMAAVGMAGVLVGDSAMFLIGRHFGERARRLRWVAYLLTPQRYARVQAKFGKYGNRLMFVARFLPGLRSAVFLTAGMTRRVSYPRFILLDGLAALISVPLWVYLGYYGAENHEWLIVWLGRSKAGIAVALGVVVLLAATWFGRRLLRRRALLRRRLARHTRRSP